MRPALPNNLLHNPFDNRFNDPVTRRHDEMQAYAYKVWLRERNQGTCHTQIIPRTMSTASPVTKRSAHVPDAIAPTHAGTFAEVFVLFVVLLLSVAMLLKLF